MLREVAQDLIDALRGRSGHLDRGHAERPAIVEDDIAQGVVDVASQTSKAKAGRVDAIRLFDADKHQQIEPAHDRAGAIDPRLEIDAISVFD